MNKLSKDWAGEVLKISKKGIEYIKEIIPNRYPFLMVDRILELGDGRVKALKNVTINEQFFTGHFPEEAVMPGVLILEGMAQTAGILINQGSKNSHQRGYLVGIDKTRFRKVVRPGDALVYQTEKVREKGGLYRIEVKATVEDELVAESTISLTLE